jgi:hypothetical protein
MRTSFADVSGLTSRVEEGSDVTATHQTAFELIQIADRLSARRGEGSQRYDVHVTHAVSSIALAVNALFASADVKCDLVDPPEDVNTRPRGPHNEMITQCFHYPPHCWNGQGQQISCP